MIIKLKKGFNLLHQKRFLFLLTILTVCISLTMGLDLIESKFNNSSFYFFESFIFSSFWLLFIPLLYGQFYFNKSQKTKALVVLWVLVPIVIHFTFYPLFVWLISLFFYNHTFSYLQTLYYELTEYSFILLAVYTVPFIIYTSFKSKQSLKSNGSGIIDSIKGNIFLTNFIVLDGKKRTNISTNDILFVSSNPPYLEIHHQAKRYMHKETLKSISEKLDSKIFIRVHKSTIVNINKVQSYKSRLNGDYDLLMNDGIEIRLSRNFAPKFKSEYSKSHPYTI